MVTPAGVSSETLYLLLSGALGIIGFIVVWYLNQVNSKLKDYGESITTIRIGQAELKTSLSSIQSDIDRRHKDNHDTLDNILRTVSSGRREVRGGD